MKEKPVKGTYSNQHDRPDLDCCVCIRRKSCANFAEGSFCSRFSSREFDPQGEDPNDLWRRGEPADLDG